MKGIKKTISATALAMFVGGALFLIVCVLMESAPARRLNTDDPRCDMGEAGTLVICEGGADETSQRRVGAVIRYGVAADQIQQKIAAYQGYSLIETDCDPLPGNMGHTCYVGASQHPSGDISFMNVYLYNDKILMLETRNIIISGAVADMPDAPEDNGARLSDFVDIDRFRKDMSE